MTTPKIFLKELLQKVSRLLSKIILSIPSFVYLQFH